MTPDLAPLRRFIERHERLFIITGAGVSTGSGIPDYRDENGEWKRKPPVTFQAFTGDELTRKRYWARSLLGWPHFRNARPNSAHLALNALEQNGNVEVILTQNVDGLHQAAGSRKVIDLHGRLDRVCCLDCGVSSPRDALQTELLARNPDWATLHATMAPDGDADPETDDFANFDVPDCANCNGLLKPDVVFFGESVPGDRVKQAFARLHNADAVLVIGSSLMVYSGFRFVRAAAEANLPIAAINQGRTRADSLLAMKVEAAASDALAFLLSTRPLASA